MQSQPREEPTGADNSDIEATTSHFKKDSRSEDVGIDTPSNGSVKVDSLIYTHIAMNLINFYVIDVCELDYLPW
jgi:hypothetical protein